MNRLRIVLLVLMALSTGCESDEQGTKQQIPTLVSDDMSDVGGAMTAMMLASGGTPDETDAAGASNDQLTMPTGGHKRSQNRPPASLFIRCLLSKIQESQRS